MISAFLWAQIENMDMIQTRRKQIWIQYNDGLKKLESEKQFKLPDIPDYATNNAHMYYVVCKSLEERSALIKYLKEVGILSVFHYLSLHKSGFYTSHCDSRPSGLQKIVEVEDEKIVEGLDLPNCDRFADCLLRLPLFYELTDDEVAFVVNSINEFYRTYK